MTNWTPEYTSWLEKRFMGYLKGWKIPGWKHNFEVDAIDGRTYYIDFAWDELKLGIECDSKQYHSSAFHKSRDAKRQRILEDSGWVIERLTSEEILNEPEKAKDKVRKWVGEAQVRKKKQVRLLNESTRLR